MKVAVRTPGLRRTVRESALILSTNPETTQALRAAGAEDVRFLSNAAVSEQLVGQVLAPRDSAQQELIVLWAGRLIPLKALTLALEAFSQIDRTLPVRLRIAGEGPLRAEMETLACSLGVTDRVEFLGAVPWLDMARQYQEADIFLFTSLRDSSGSVIAEAMAFHLPILTLNHQGVGAIVPPDAAIKVPVTTPEETVDALADGLRRLVLSPELRKEMGEAGWIYAQSMSWQGQVEQVTKWYEEILASSRATRRHVYAAL